MNNEIDDLNEEDVIDIVKNLSIDEYEWYSGCKKYEGHNEDIALIVRIAINKFLDLYYKQKQITKNAITIIREMDLSKILSPLDDEFLEEYIYSYTTIKEMPVLNPYKKNIYGDENKIMFNKCINCNKWITCNDASEEKNNCENFDFKRIQIKKDEREIKNEEKKENKKSN